MGTRDGIYQPLLFCPLWVKVPPTPRYMVRPGDPAFPMANNITKKEITASQHPLVSVLRTLQRQVAARRMQKDGRMTHPLSLYIPPAAAGLRKVFRAKTRGRSAVQGTHTDIHVSCTVNGVYESLLFCPLWVKV